MKEHGNMALAASALLDACVKFPGLIDGQTDVNGGDLVEFLTSKIACIPMQFVEEELSEYNKEG